MVSWRTEQQTKSRQTVVEIAKVVMGGIVGLAIGYFILLVVKPEADFLGLLSDDVPKVEPANDPTPLPPPPPPPPPRSRRQPPAPTDPDEPASTEPAESAATLDPIVGSDTTDSQGTTPTPFPPPARKVRPPSQSAARSLPFAKMPSSVVLPSISDRGGKLLGDVAIGDHEEITLTSISEPFELGGRTWTIQVSPDESGTRWPVHFVSSEDESRLDGPAVGEFFVEDHSLRFRWLEAARSGHATQLENTHVRISIGDTSKVVALREPKKQPAVVLDLESTRDVRKIEIDNCPDPSQLGLEVFGLAGLRTPARFKNDKSIAKFGRDVTILLESKPGAELRVRLMKRSKEGLVLQIVPVFVEKGGRNEYELTLPRLKSAREGTERAIADAKVRLPTLQGELDALRRQYIAISSIGTSNMGEATLKRRQLESLGTNIKTASRRLGILNKKIPVLLVRMEALPGLESLVNSLHGKATLRYRVFVPVDEEQLVLLQGGENILASRNLVVGDHGQTPPTQPPAFTSNQPFRGAPKTETKLPAPGAGDLDKSLSDVKELFEKEYARAKTLHEKQNFGRQMFGTALETADDPSGRYALLQVARDISAGSGDAKTACAVVDAMDKWYVIDSLEMKRGALTKAAGYSDSRETNAWIASTALSLTAEAVKQDRYDIGSQLVVVAKSTSLKANNRDLRTSAAEQEQWVAKLQKAYEEVGTALSEWEANPADPDANLALGRFYCFLKGDWTRGGPMLALGSDKALSEAVRKELRKGTSPDECRSVGDTWWNAAEGQDNIRSKKQLQERAAYWYRKAIPGLKGLKKIIIQQRLDKVVPADSEPSDRHRGTGTAD